VCRIRDANRIGLKRGSRTRQRWECAEQSSPGGELLKNLAVYRIHEDATSLQAVLEHSSRAAGISSMKMLRLNLLTGRRFSDNFVMLNEKFYRRFQSKPTGTSDTAGDKDLRRKHAKFTMV